MDEELQQFVLAKTGANAFHKIACIQSLWSGYGSLDRYALEGAERSHLIVKHVRFPAQANHPRGWSTDRSDQRKRRSYEVETAWYEHHAARCDASCRVPKCLGVMHRDKEVVLLLEDLSESGYPRAVQAANDTHLAVGLTWLAKFHALFMQEKPKGLWPIGTYWHLDTRPDEWNEMEVGALKNAASEVDRLLNETPYLTFVHGDAKLANFLFSEDGQQIAAVDFQYIGGGCGMKDVAYFISSCLDENECERKEEQLLHFYFKALKEALARRKPEINAQAVEQAWRPMYAVAWTDFYRFLKGWSPGHWKIHAYSERLAEEVLRSTM